MDEQSVANLVKSTPKNDGFWRFEEQEKNIVKVQKMTNYYTEGHNKIFSYYGRDLPASTKWFIGYTAVLLNPVTGEVFMQDYGRFTFLLKHLPLPYNRNQKIRSLDGDFDISIMGKAWSGFYGDEDIDEDALMVKQIYEFTNK